MQEIKKMILEEQIQTDFLKGIKSDELISNLKNKNIVIDIRSTIWMPLYYRPAPLKELLNKNGITYIYCKDLGNPSKFRKKAKNDARKEKEIINEKDLHPLSTNDCRFTCNDIIQFKKEFKNKKIIWRNKPTNAFKAWKEWQDIDINLMDKLTKKYYLNYIKGKKLDFLEKLIDLIKKNPNIIFTLICSCNTLNPLRCHRFWLKEALINLRRQELGEIREAKFQPNLDRFLKPKISNTIIKGDKA